MNSFLEGKRDNVIPFSSNGEGGSKREMNEKNNSSQEDTEKYKMLFWMCVQVPAMMKFLPDPPLCREFGEWFRENVEKVIQGNQKGNHLPMEIANGIRGAIQDVGVMVDNDAPLTDDVILKVGVLLENGGEAEKKILQLGEVVLSYFEKMKEIERKEA